MLFLHVLQQKYYEVIRIFLFKISNSLYIYINIYIKRKKFWGPVRSHPSPAPANRNLNKILIQIIKHEHVDLQVQ